MVYILPLFLVFFMFDKLQAQENFITSAFDEYVANMVTNCDFTRDFPRQMFDSLSAEPRAACLQLAREIEATGRIVFRMDGAIPCEQKTDTPIHLCQQNLKLCRSKLLILKRSVESCRHKVKVDTYQALKYKVN